LYFHEHYLFFIPRIIYKLPIPNRFILDSNMNPKFSISHNIHTLKISIFPTDIYNIEFMFMHITHHGNHHRRHQKYQSNQNWATQYMSSGRSPPAAKRFMVKPRKKMAKTYVSPGGSQTVARRFLENPKMRITRGKNGFHNSIMIQIIHSQDR